MKNRVPLKIKLMNLLFVLSRKKQPPFPSDEKEIQIYMEKHAQYIRQQDYDVFTLSEKQRGNLKIDRIDLKNCQSWLISSQSNRNDKIIYYIHGGGFTGGCTRLSYGFIRFIVENYGYNMFSVDYRLAPDFKHPCAINDCLDGYQALLSKGFHGKDIILIGDSAGGNLVIALGLYLKEKGIELPAGICSCSPITQFDTNTDSYRRCSYKTDFIVSKELTQMYYHNIYFAKEEIENPLVAPLYGDFSGFPPLYLDCSDYESLRDDAWMVKEKAEKAGVIVDFNEYHGYPHAFTMCNAKEVAKTVYPHLFEFIGKCFQD